MRDLLDCNPLFRAKFEENLKLWKRFIDDCGGVFLGKDEFNVFFELLNNQFNKFDLFLTNEISEKLIHLLDIEIFIENGQFHTREYRKQTASNSFVKFGSAHPSHCFKGIVKSQLLRLRRLCSRDRDFLEAVEKLRTRCINSGYCQQMVENILLQANTLQRNLVPQPRNSNTEINSVRWVILSGTPYEKTIERFMQAV